MYYVTAIHEHQPNNIFFTYEKLTRTVFASIFITYSSDIFIHSEYILNYCMKKWETQVGPWECTGKLIQNGSQFHDIAGLT